MLVPEVTGADDPAVAILNLEHRETGEAHRRPCVVEQILPFRLDAGDRRQTEAVVVRASALSSDASRSAIPALSRCEIFANDLDRTDRREAGTPAESRRVISCRSPNASSAIGISTTAANARSRRVRRLIVISDRLLLQ